MLNVHWSRHLFYTWLLARCTLLCCFIRQKAIFPLLLLVVPLHITKILIAFLVICLVLSFHLTGKTILGRMKGVTCFKAVMHG